MNSLLISLLLLIVSNIIQKNTNLITKRQQLYLNVSTLSYIFIFGIIMIGLMSNESFFVSILGSLIDGNIYIPLVFYILWFISTAIIINKINFSGDYIGFYDTNNKYVSERKIKYD